MSLRAYGGDLSKIQESLLVKHIKKWGDPNFSSYCTTYEYISESGQKWLYFNTEKYEIKFWGGYSNRWGVANIVNPFTLNSVMNAWDEPMLSFNKPAPHKENGHPNYQCPCYKPFYYSKASDEELDAIKSRVGSRVHILK